MKKVGILSMQRIKNYGSFLQAYALKTMIEELGNKVEFVDYRVGKSLIKEENNNDNFSKITSILKGDAPLIQKIQYINHKKNFQKKYLLKLNLTEYPNYTPKLDVLIIGSDEVFNCIQKNKNVGYSLELFGKDNNSKKLITYAASFGNTTFDKLKKYEKDEEIGNLLSKIDKISVRDKNSGNVVKNLTNKKVLYNLDPVLVFDYPNREGLIPNIKNSAKYMIVYAYNNRISKEETKFIKDYAKKNKLKVYAIGGAQNCADKFIDCSPFEVLSYFKNAECIITDTYHGSIFSIIMQKQFVTLVRKSFENKYGNEEKITDLLERMKLKDRMIMSVNEIEKIIKKEINYTLTNEIISRETKKTKKYLTEI